MVEIVLVTSSSVIYEPRIDKVVRSLSKKYSISVLGWNRDDIKNLEVEEYYVNLDLFNIRTSFWKPTLWRMLLRLVGFISLFWIWAFIKLVQYRPSIVHACDLDALIPCYLYKVLFRKKILFEVIDRYAMLYIPKRFKLLYSAVNSVEEHLAEHSDALIVAGGQKVYETFQKRPKNSHVIMNCSVDSTIKSKLGQMKNEKFTLIYSGLIRHHRSLGTVAAAIENMSGIELVLVGAIYDNDLHKELLHTANTKYVGKLKPQDTLDLEASSDVMIALYDLGDAQNIYVVPNKVLEAMMCGIPVITNIAQDLVRELDCGIIVDYDNLDQIKQAIVLLRDNENLRIKLGKNGRKAFEEKYNWDLMEKKLYQIYDNLQQK